MEAIEQLTRDVREGRIDARRLDGDPVARTGRGTQPIPYLPLLVPSTVNEPKAL